MIAHVPAYFPLAYGTIRSQKANLRGSRSWWVQLLLVVPQISPKPAAEEGNQTTTMKFCMHGRHIILTQMLN
jgi:hypothetical protein